MEKYQSVIYKHCEVGIRNFETVRKSEIMRQNMIVKSLKLEEERKKKLEELLVINQKEN